MPELRILIADDDEVAAELLAILLRMYGHEVEVVHDGPSGLRMAADKPPDVALLDLDLPGGMDGCDVARG